VKDKIPEKTVFSGFPKEKIFGRFSWFPWESQNNFLSLYKRERESATPEFARAARSLEVRERALVLWVPRPEFWFSAGGPTHTTTQVPRPRLKSPAQAFPAAMPDQTPERRPDHA